MGVLQLPVPRQRLFAPQLSEQRLLPPRPPESALVGIALPAEARLLRLALLTLPVAGLGEAAPLPAPAPVAMMPVTVQPLALLPRRASVLQPPLWQPWVPALAKVSELESVPLREMASVSVLALCTLALLVTGPRALSPPHRAPPLMVSKWVPVLPLRTVALVSVQSLYMPRAPLRRAPLPLALP